MNHNVLGFIRRVFQVIWEYNLIGLSVLLIQSMFTAVPAACRSFFSSDCEQLSLYFLKNRVRCLLLYFTRRLFSKQINGQVIFFYFWIRALIIFMGNLSLLQLFQDAILQLLSLWEILLSALLPSSLWKPLHMPARFSITIEEDADIVDCRL